MQASDAACLSKKPAALVSAKGLNSKRLKRQAYEIVSDGSAASGTYLATMEMK
jgi:hypothetical protein